MRLELQADYLAGVWAHYGQEKFNFIEPGDIESAITSANAIGDDRLQKRSTGFTSPENYTHGTSEQRVSWFRRGLETGDLSMLKRSSRCPTTSYRSPPGDRLARKMMSTPAWTSLEEGGSAMSLEAIGWYTSIFAWLFFTGIGIPPCPEEAGILYAASVAALQPSVHWWLAWPITGQGIVCADMVLLPIGRFWGHHLFEYRWVQYVVSLERRAIESRFEQHGVKILLLARLLPPLRTGVFVTAGAIRYSFLPFLLADMAYAVVGVGVFFLGSKWIIGLISLGGHWLVYIGLGGIVYLLYRYFRYLRERAEAESPRTRLGAGDARAGGEGWPGHGRRRGHQGRRRTRSPRGGRDRQGGISTPAPLE